MRKVLYVILACAAMTGCRTTKAIDTVHQDFASVIFDDGISEEEAIFIAKKQVKDRTPPQSYFIDQPKVVTEFEDIPHHEDFWFISFPPAEKSTVPSVFMVVTRKDNGKIVFSRSYIPENEWVLQAVILKLYEKQKRIDPR